VGGRRKRFDAALVDEHRLLHLADRLNLNSVIALVDAERPALVAIDSPCTCAPDGKTARLGERLLAKTVCGIRWTPDEAKVRAGGYYEWVVEGLALYAALAARGVAAIEVFPTASWTRWRGRRGTQTRAAWTSEGLMALALEDVPERTNQDQRDAIAAALTAREYSQGLTERFGEIVVPSPRSADDDRTALPGRAAGPG
jgi:predicted nuclease with RNAse H fold